MNGGLKQMLTRGTAALTMTVLAATLGAMVLGATPTSAQASEPALSDSQFVNLYVELSLAAETFLGDTVKLPAVQDTIFTRYKITRANFLTFTDKYQKAEQYSSIWDTILKKLEARRASNGDSLLSVTPSNAPAKPVGTTPPPPSSTTKPAEKSKGK